MRPVPVALLLLLMSGFMAVAEERLETFDHDPGWDGLHNRPQADQARTVVQDFGYALHTSGDGRAAIGGQITPDGQPAYYAKALAPCTFSDSFSASGRVLVAPGAGNALVGFFNADTINEWRTPNSLVLRINGRGDTFHVHVELATARWRATAGVFGTYDGVADRNYPIDYPSGRWYDWSLRYSPDASANGGHHIVASFGDETRACTLTQDFLGDGASFNHFGLLNVVKSVDTPGELWLKDLVLNGTVQDLRTDPKWDALRNFASYPSLEVRPLLDMGYSPTQFAGGASPGEFGGRFFRGDCRDGEKLGYYGAPLERLCLDQPLRASGRLAFRRGVSDSTSLFGFFDSRASVEVNPSQQFSTPMNFLGFAVEGPSAQGFYVYPIYRFPQDRHGHAPYEQAPPIFPDGTSHAWTLTYDPQAAPPQIALTLDDKRVVLPLGGEDVAAGATFDRFGFVTPWIDGNAQVVYLDDIEYTCRQ